jgi:putative phosphoribosyl transferase
MHESPDGGYGGGRRLSMANDSTHAADAPELREIEIQAGDVALPGHLRLPRGSKSLTVFVHGSGSSRHSPRNNYVAQHLSERGIATFLFDLLTEEEDRSRDTRFDIDLLTRRLAGVLDALPEHDVYPAGVARYDAISLFGASTGAAAALRVAADERWRNQLCAVVSRGGRPDLAGGALEAVHTPTLLIVGGNDTPVIDLNESAKKKIPGSVELEIVPGATHLFEEPGALDHVAKTATAWVQSHCGD